MITLLFSLTVCGQRECRVLLPGLDSVYVGKCKGGLADGSGEAWGKFHYTGKFSNGYPQGKGRAEYSDGTVYDGLWKKGMKQGKGTLYKKGNGKISERTGIWEKDSLIKELILPSYKVISQDNLIRVRVYKQSEGSYIWFYPVSTGGVISDFEDVRLTGNSGTEIIARPRLGYQDVRFPFTGSIRYSAWNKMRTTQVEISMEIEIYEPGTWVIETQN